MADPKITPTGMSQGDLVQLVKEIVYTLVADVAGVDQTKFTIDVVGKDGVLAGKNQS